MEFDAATETMLALLYPDYATRLRNLLEDVFLKTGRVMRVTEGLRSFARQNELWKQGRVTVGVNPRVGRALGSTVTDATAGLSIHHYGVAADSCFIGRDPYLSATVAGEDAWQQFGRTAESFGLAWGGDFSNGRVDRPHTELNYGIRVQDMRELFEQGGISMLWSQFDKMRGVPVGTAWSDRKLFDPNQPIGD